MINLTSYNKSITPCVNLRPKLTDNLQLTTPGRSCSDSTLGPSPGCGVGGGEESEEESGEEGALPPTDPSLTVNT